MGSASSKNVAKAVVDIYSKVAAETVQKSQISSSNTQIVSVTNTTGDVNISGNTITQRVNLNMSALMDSVSNVENSQRIAEQLDQLAKSVVSGLNFFTFDNAQNTAESIVKSQTEITNKIKQSCTFASNNFQKITVKNTSGSVNITNNVLSQIVDIFDKCALKSVLGVKVIDDVQNRINQSAETKLEGFNLVWVVILIAIIILVPVVTAGRVASTALRFMFPLMIVVGIIFSVLYGVLGKTYMKATYFTRPFKDVCPAAVRDPTINTTTTNVKQAHDTCLNTPTCKVVDARLTTNGTTQRPAPEITFYSTGDSCALPVYNEPIGAVADVTSIKSRQRYSWMLYIGIALIIGGLLGTVIQFRRGRSGSSGSSGSSGTSEGIELQTFRTSETSL